METINVRFSIKDHGWGLENEFIECVYDIQNNIATVNGYPKLVRNINHGDSIKVEKNEEEYKYVSTLNKSGEFGYRVIFLDKSIKAEDIFIFLKIFHRLGAKIDKPLYLVACIFFTKDKNKIEIENILNSITSPKIAYELI